jgi:hypothetical protein
MKPLFLYLLLLTVLLYFGCKKEEPPTIPVLSTIAVSNATATTATSGGNITSDGRSALIAIGVCWSTNINPIVHDSKTTDGARAGTFVCVLSGLTPGTTYHVRAYATNSVGTAYGDDIAFTTSGLAPSATTRPVINISATGATLFGTVNANGLSTTVTFEYGTTTSYNSTVTASQSPLAGNGITDFSVDISGLMPGTAYHFRVKTVNNMGTAYGDDIIFTTLGQAPTATTQPATNISTTVVTVNGFVNANDLSTTLTFEYGSTTSYGSTIKASQSPVTGNSLTGVSADIPDLTPLTTYHFRVKAENSLGTDFGDDVTFTTMGLQAPIVTTLTATDISTTAATINGTVNANDLATTVTFEYGTSTSYGTADTAYQSPATGDSISNVSYMIADLTPGTTYHFRVRAENSHGTVYGSDVEFTTSASSSKAPEVQTLAATNISATGATLNGTVNAKGLNTTVKFTYTIAGGHGRYTSGSVTAVQSPVAGDSIIHVSANACCFNSGTTHNFRVWATNAYGTVSGSALSFKTH